MISENFEFLNIIVVKNVTYNNYPIEGETEQLQISDDINFDYGESGMRISITRKVWFEPNPIFDLEVTIETYLEEKEDSTYDKRELSVEELIENFEQPIGAVCAKISAIISTMTMFSNDAPLVTPPNLINSDK